MSDELDCLRLDNQLCFALYAATHAITRLYRSLLAEFGLTYPQYIVLLVLLERRESTVNGIAESLRLDAATVTPLLKRLADAGWISRERSRTDERVVLVQLTVRGEALGAPLAELQRNVRCNTGLDDESFTRLRQALNELTDTLTKVLVDPTARG